ncbi:MAG: hypothetical protein IJE26_05550, partial [Oscillospiraceae bacterium]|nr:hypothetical protein [Oscillospiraceae bacterium]
AAGEAAEQGQHGKEGAFFHSVLLKTQSLFYKDTIIYPNCKEDRLKCVIFPLFLWKKLCYTTIVLLSVESYFK